MRGTKYVSDCLLHKILIARLYISSPVMRVESLLSKGSVIGRVQNSLLAHLHSAATMFQIRDGVAWPVAPTRSIAKWQSPRRGIPVRRRCGLRSSIRTMQDPMASGESACQTVFQVLSDNLNLWGVFLCQKKSQRIIALHQRPLLPLKGSAKRLWPICLDCS